VTIAAITIAVYYWSYNAGQIPLTKSVSAYKKLLLAEDAGRQVGRYGLKSLRENDHIESRRDG
jgi:hypothetical protein